MKTNSSLVIAVIEQAGLPPLRVGFTLAVIVFLLAGVFIWRRRHQFFDCDSNVENDVPVVRHKREEEILFVWSGRTLVLLGKTSRPPPSSSLHRIPRGLAAKHC